GYCEFAAEDAPTGTCGGLHIPGVGSPCVYAGPTPVCDATSTPNQVFDSSGVFACRCEAKHLVGSSCVQASDCETSLCVNRICAAKHDNGQPCPSFLPAECLSGWCVLVNTSPICQARPVCE